MSITKRAIDWLNMWFCDHGLVRSIHNNFYRIDEHLYRASQPSPTQIRYYKKRYAINSIINLRGVNHYGSYRLEEEVCQGLGINLHNNTRIYSREAPSVVEINNLVALFQRLEYPALLHCKAGADRAGLAAAIYRMAILGHLASDAKKELAVRYGHFRQAKTGILDEFVEAYEVRNKISPISFMNWVNQEYDPAMLNNSNGRSWANHLIDKVLRRE